MGRPLRASCIAAFYTNGQDGPMIVRSLIAVFTSGLLLAGCSRTPDDQRIRETIESMRHATEEHDPRGFLKFVSADFSGNEGSVDRDGLGNLLRVEVLRNDSVDVTLGPIDVQLLGDRATVGLVATITAGKGGVLPEHAAIYSITSGWRRENREWICYAARWDQKL
jgi:hypothetical protein